ncbi:uncharacterized protein [Aegilops tauschii subsp. strangulata]|uniref:uncharacterized protein n=1 Tax=Aegilops tauschii subsp. strangulata TaxID=200361 RepID=UPI003CC87607
MFKKSNGDEWIAGLNVEYNTVLGKEKNLKEEERKKPIVIQVCVHNLSLLYHICHADIECEDLKNYLMDGKVKFTYVDFTNDIKVLDQIGLVVGQPFDLQRNELVSSSQPSMLTLAAAMVDPSCVLLHDTIH